MQVDARRDGLTEERAATTVTLSKVMRAPQLQLSEDGLTVTGNKGFRTVRATHGTHQGGAWYCEVTVGQLGATGHVRVGWCTSRAELQAPVGFDAYGFCYRDVDGSKVTEGRREAYGEGYKEGDVVSVRTHIAASKLSQSQVHSFTSSHASRFACKTAVANPCGERTRRAVRCMGGI